MNPIYNHSKKGATSALSLGMRSWLLQMWSLEMSGFVLVSLICFISLLFIDPSGQANIFWPSLSFDPSGQSNMVFTMNQIFNSTEEMEASVGYTDIRFTVLKRVASDVEQEDIEPQVSILLLLNMNIGNPHFLWRSLGLTHQTLDTLNLCQLCASSLPEVSMTRNLKGDLISIWWFERQKDFPGLKTCFCKWGTPSSGFDWLGRGRHQVLAKQKYRVDDTSTSIKMMIVFSTFCGSHFAGWKPGQHLRALQVVALKGRSLRTTHRWVEAWLIQRSNQILWGTAYHICRIQTRTCGTPWLHRCADSISMVSSGIRWRNRHTCFLPLYLWTIGLGWSK